MTDTSIHLSRRPARHPSVGWPDRAAYRGVDPGRPVPVRTDVWPAFAATGAESDRRPTTLRGRRGECAVLAGLLDGARAGRSAVLVLQGEAGVGKSALLDYAVAAAADLRVVRSAGVEPEMRLAFAGLHQLCGPVLDRLGRLPAPQRAALETAFGQEAGPAPDRFLVGLAVLSLLSEAAGERPLLCVVDDAQWLDRASAQALAFAARRLATESALVLFAAREPCADLRGLPELVVGDLAAVDARELLDSVLWWPADDRVRDQIVAETRGNPLALVDLPRRLSPAELAGGFRLAAALPVPGRIEQEFGRRAAALPAPTRLLLVAAAAEPTGDPVLVRRAAERLGICAQAAATPAAQAGLFELGARVRFRHPLVRAAAYQSASPADRQRVHRALAEAADPDADPDRSAWHRAQAAPGPDEDVAAGLERSAGLAQARGGLAAAAAFLERAAALTPDPAQRAERALGAAQANIQAGALDAVPKLLGVATAGPPDELRDARVDLLYARLAFVSDRGREAPPLLLEAARRLERIDTDLARAAYLDTMNAAMFAGRLGAPGAPGAAGAPGAQGGGTLEVARAARAAPRPSHPLRAPDLLLDGLAARCTEGYAAGLPILRRALSALGRDVSATDALGWLWPACVAAIQLWDDSQWDAASRRYVRLALDAGALSELPLARTARAYLELFAGELTAAAALISEAEATPGNFPPYGALGLAAWRGREDETATLTEATIAEVTPRGEGIGLTVTEWAHAVLYNGLGRYDEALAAAEQARQYPDELGLATWSLVELIEAAARTGQTEHATGILRRLAESTSAAGTDWALGIEMRSRALLSGGEFADRLYREAIQRLSRTRVRAELARAHLLYGEWLRRQNRRVDARKELRCSYEMLTAMGIEGFAERARRELLATGETVRKRTVETVGELTAQEAEIARLAADGQTNPEIGAKLFLSPRTVEWHLRKVFTKLAIRSRKELREALPARIQTTLPA
jgi:DNA-binding CsgD family transcriptional regulator